MKMEQDNIAIHKLDASIVLNNWPLIRPFLLSALTKFDTDKKYPIDFVLLDLVRGDSQAWAIIKDGKIISASVTSINHLPEGKSLFLFLTGGEGMHEWGTKLHDAFVAYAKENGAKWIDTCSRRGIGKMFYDGLGYVRKSENYTYEVK